MTSELPEPLDVIAVGAHPDDVEIAVGGTLARLVQQGHRVGIVDLTDGEPTPGSPSPDVRLAEAEEAARILGVQVRETREGRLDHRLRAEVIEEAEVRVIRDDHELRTA